MEKLPEHYSGETINGFRYVIARKPFDYPALKEHYQGQAVVFLPHEVHALKGMTKDQAEIMLRQKRFWGGEITETRPIKEDHSRDATKKVVNIWDARKRRK